MRIFSKKSFIFGKGEHEVSVRNQEIVDVPDYVAETKLFKLAVSCGDVEILGTKSDEKAVEKNGTKKPKTKEEKEKSSKKE